METYGILTYGVANGKRVYELDMTKTTVNHKRSTVWQHKRIRICTKNKSSKNYSSGKSTAYLYSVNNGGIDMTTIFRCIRYLLFHNAEIIFDGRTNVEAI